MSSGFMSDAVTIQERIVRLALLEGLVSDEQLASVAGGSGDCEELIRSGALSQDDVDHLLGIATEMKLELNRIQDSHFGALRPRREAAFQSDAPILVSEFEDGVVDTALPPEQWRPISEIFFDVVLFFWYLPLRLPRPARLAMGLGVLAACAFACVKYWPEISTFLMPPHMDQPQVVVESTTYSDFPDVSEARHAEPVDVFDGMRGDLLKFAVAGDLKSGLEHLAAMNGVDYSEQDRKSRALATCTFQLARGNKRAWPEMAGLLVESVDLDSVPWRQHFAAWLLHADRAGSEDAIRRISETMDASSPTFRRIDSWVTARFGDAASAASVLKEIPQPEPTDRIFLATALFRDGLANSARDEFGAVVKSAEASAMQTPATWEDFGDATCSKIFLDAARKLSKQLGGR